MGRNFRRAYTPAQSNPRKCRCTPCSFPLQFSLPSRNQACETAWNSDLKYISVTSSTDEWDFLGVHCNIKNKTQKDVVKTLSKDQDIIVRGKITDVGEVLGYYLDITDIFAE